MLLVLAVIAIMVLAIFLSGPKPVENALTPTEETTASTEITPQTSETPDPNAQLQKEEYGITTGVIVGTVGILLIIFVGTGGNCNEIRSRIKIQLSHNNPDMICNCGILNIFSALAGRTCASAAGLPVPSVPHGQV